MEESEGVGDNDRATTDKEEILNERGGQELEKVRDDGETEASGRKTSPFTAIAKGIQLSRRPRGENKKNSADVCDVTTSTRPLPPNRRGASSHPPSSPHENHIKYSTKTTTGMKSHGEKGQREKQKGKEGLGKRERGGVKLGRDPAFSSTFLTQRY